MNRLLICASLTKAKCRLSSGLLCTSPNKCNIHCSFGGLMTWWLFLLKPPLSSGSSSMSDDSDHFDLAQIKFLSFNCVSRTGMDWSNAWIHVGAYADLHYEDRVSARHDQSTSNDHRSPLQNFDRAVIQKLQKPSFDHLERSSSDRRVGSSIPKPPVDIWNCSQGRQ